MPKIKMGVVPSEGSEFSVDSAKAHQIKLSDRKRNLWKTKGSRRKFTEKIGGHHSRIALMGALRVNKEEGTKKGFIVKRRTHHGQFSQHGLIAIKTWGQTLLLLSKSLRGERV